MTVYKLFDGSFRKKIFSFLFKSSQTVITTNQCLTDSHVCFVFQNVIHADSCRNLFQNLEKKFFFSKSTQLQHFATGKNKYSLVRSRDMLKAIGHLWRFFSPIKLFSLFCFFLCSVLKLEIINFVFSVISTIKLFQFL